MKVTLHACCGPCLIEPYDALLRQGHDVLVVYANPNIHPLSEYERRRDALLDYAEARGIEVVEAVYEPAEWIAAVGEAASGAGRCELCHRLRLGAAARIAAERGSEALFTTLTVSPYQDQAAIGRAGEAACAEAGVRYVPTDFRDLYPEAVRRSKVLGMYRQRYCGCVLSELEAARARRAREARRSKGE